MDLPSGSAPFFSFSSNRRVQLQIDSAVLLTSQDQPREKKATTGGAAREFSPQLQSKSRPCGFLTSTSDFVADFSMSLSPKLEKKTIARRSVSHPRQPGFEPNRAGWIPGTLDRSPAERDEPQIHGGIADPWNDDATQGESSQKIVMSGSNSTPFGWDLPATTVGLSPTCHLRLQSRTLTNHDSLTGQLPTLQQYSTALLRKAVSSPEPSSDEGPRGDFRLCGQSRKSPIATCFLIALLHHLLSLTSLTWRGDVYLPSRYPAMETEEYHQPITGLPGCPSTPRSASRAGPRLPRCTHAHPRRR